MAEYFAGKQHSHTVPVPLSMQLNATTGGNATNLYGDEANFREACWDWPRGWEDPTPGVGFFTCSTYEARGWCTSGGYGTWDKDRFARPADADGVDATQACCVCGGGRRVTVVDTETAWTEEAGVVPERMDKFGEMFFLFVVMLFAIFAGRNNVGTVDPLGVFSVYADTSMWKAAVTHLYSFTMCVGITASTHFLLQASSGVDIVLNALAIMFFVDLDEQLLAALLPLVTRAAIARVFREARDQVDGGEAWRMWKSGWVGMFKYFFGLCGLCTYVRGRRAARK